MSTFGTYATKGTFNENPPYDSEHIFDELRDKIDSVMDKTVSADDLKKANETYQLARTVELSYELQLKALHVEQNVAWFYTWRDTDSLGKGVTDSSELMQRYHESQEATTKAKTSLDDMTRKRVAAAISFISEYPELIANDWIEIRRLPNDDVCAQIVYNPKYKPPALQQIYNCPEAIAVLEKGEYVLSHNYVDEGNDVEVFVLVRKDVAMQVMVVHDA